MPVSYDRLIEKCAPVLNEESAGTIIDHHKKAVNAAVLENQEIALREEGLISEAAPGNATTSVANWTFDFTGLLLSSISLPFLPSAWPSMPQASHHRQALPAFC